MKHVELKVFKGNRRGQSTVEYILMVAMGALFSIQITRFFNDVFKDGLVGLEKNIASEMATGLGFGNSD
ncbi:MAG: hypothetical protein FJ116_01230 [Deltaproteobacteria bacterium]|nr:hypothetical protein [Deltaproteobacteria bacterium]